MIQINNGTTPPNIVMGDNVERELPAGQRLVLPPAMGFIADAALKYPKWKFKVTRMTDTSIPNETKFYMATRFEVRDERDQELGKVYLAGWSYHQDTVEFRNERISRAIERGDCKRTTKQDVALKLLKKWFTTPPVSEVLEVAFEKVSYDYANRSSSINREYRNSIGVVMSGLEQYVMDNIDEYWNKAKFLPTPPFTLEQLKAARQDVEIVGAMEKQKFLTVVIRDGKYLIRTSDGTIRVQAHEDLSERLRRSLGLLKLVEPKQFVGGAGFKGKEDVFFVVDDQPQT
jgi:hypothetical protein